MLSKTLSNTLTGMLSRTLSQPVANTGDPLAAAWIALEEAAGYTFGAGEKAAVNTAFTDLRSNNLLTKVARLQLLCMGSSARNAIPLIGSGGSFMGGITHNTKSVTYNGSTGVIDTNVNASTCGWTDTNMHWGYYLAAVVGADSSTLHGIASGAAGTIQGSTRFSTLGSFADFPTTSGTARISAASNGAKGVRSYHKYNTSSARITNYAGTQTVVASGAGLSSTGVVLPSLSLYVGARNNLGSADLFTSETHSALWACSGMTTTDNDVFDVILYNLVTAFGAN